jgi:predicted O-methyltransferase YrrM
MNEARRRFADALYAKGKEHDESRPDRLERFRNVEPPTAELLGVLIRATGARRILEHPGYVCDLVRALAPGGLPAVDNVRSHEHELVEFTALIEAEPALTQTVVPVGAGLRLAALDRAPAG